MTQLNNGLTALETRYAGYRFRSRIEARWAVFFTRLGLDWQYEPQGYRVGRAKLPYLPDFYLPTQALFVEVKPGFADQVDPEGVNRWEEFAGEVVTAWPTSRAAIFCGRIPDPEKVTNAGPVWSGRWYDDGIYVTGECCYAWCACPSGKHFDIQFEGRSGRILCGCERAFDDRYQGGDDQRIINAYAAARSARFEHGEAAA
jgi:hypothetical protein